MSLHCRAGIIMMVVTDRGGNSSGGGSNPNNYIPPSNCNPDPNYVDPHIIYPDGSMSMPACSDIPVPQEPPSSPAATAVQGLTVGLSLSVGDIRHQFIVTHTTTAAGLYNYLETNTWSAANIEFIYWVISYLAENPQEDLNNLLINRQSLYYTDAEMEAMIDAVEDPITGNGIDLYLVMKYQGSKLFELSRYSKAGNSVQAGVYTLTPHYSKNGTLLFYAAGRGSQNGIEYIVRANQLSSFTSKVDYYTAAADLVYMNGIPSKGMIQAMSGDRIGGLLEMWSDAVQSPDYWIYLGSLYATMSNNPTITTRVVTEASKPFTPRLSPLGLGSTGRTVANNLTEQLAMKEIMSNPHSGTVIIQSISDIRWMGWSKMSSMSAHGVEIHYVAKFENGIIKAVDDFKFK